MDHLIENKGFETNRVMYFKNDGTMYKGLKTEGYFYQLDQDTAVASYEKHVVNGVVWHDVSYRGYRGWVKASDLTMVSPKVSSDYVKIMHLNENENYYKTLEGQIVVVNSKLKVKEKMEQHINDMKINGAKMADFFKKFPLEIHDLRN